MKQRWMKMRKVLAGLMVGACVLGAGSVTAFANVDEVAVAAAEAQETAGAATTESTAEQTEEAAEQAETTTEQAEVTEEPVIDRSNTADDETDTGTAFSVPGNGEVLDNISGDSTKEFYTIRTANNNTFYMVIDRSSTSENVYMLSMIDEDDLSEFLGETETTETQTTTPAVVIEEDTQGTTEADTQETEKGSKAKNLGGYVMIGIIAVIGLAAYYFLKIRPKKDEDDLPSENLEMDSGLEMINEDEEDED